MKILLLYWHTIRYLKPVQFVFLLLHPVRIGFWNFFRPVPRSMESLRIRTELSFPYAFIHAHYASPLQFTLLNRSKRFPDRVDWRFDAYGKLWNYQLQYLDVLLDERIPPEERMDMLRDFSKELVLRRYPMEPYPLSLRLIHTLVFLSQHPQRELVVDQAIRMQLYFLESNRELHLQANHLLENEIALSFCYSILNEKDALRYQFKRLGEQLKEQILADGAHYERTITYHNLILYRLLLLVRSLEQFAGFEKESLHLKAVCGNMLSWSRQMAVDGQNFPCFNDAVPLHTPGLDALLQWAAYEKIEVSKLPLGASGFRKLNNAKASLWINCGNITPSYQPGHAHADQLHFMLYIGGRAVLTDPGVSSYECGPVRDLERSTRMHNTVCCGEQNQSELWAAFRMGRRAKVQILEASGSSLTAETIWYQGYKHLRKFNLLEDKLVIEDSFVILNPKFVEPEAQFHFEPGIGLIPDQEDSDQWNANGWTIRFKGHKGMEWKKYEKALHFNHLAKAEKLCVPFDGHLITEICWGQ
ncbi:MAG TPA: heparinase II/III-family protein [Saprospiraceae bacterium]|nr:heparinase II/III-family protein [Saprospiraceae bacterium]